MSQGCNPLRALVIGAGPAAVYMHLPVLASLRDRGQLALSVVCDLQHERALSAQQRFGFLEATGDAAAALARADIDIVYAFGSAQMHFDCGIAALRSGKHLFVEKPVAGSYAQAREMAEVARGSGTIAVGGHNRRFYRSLAAVRDKLGKAGSRFAEAVCHKPELGKPVLFGARSWLSANGVHALDALVFMMGGLPEQIAALATEEQPAQQPGTFSAIMRWRDGAQGVFLCNNNSGARREEYVFHGLGTVYRVSETQVTIECDRAPPEVLPFESLGDGVEAEHESFLQAVHSGAQPPHAIEALAPSLFLTELIEQGFTGQVELPAAVGFQPRAEVASRKAILVTKSAGLQAALVRWLPQYQWVSVEDLSRSPDPRPEIVGAILGRGSAALEADLLDKMPGLAVVGIAGLSFSHYAPERLLGRGVALVNATRAHAQTVAEFALGLAILGRRCAFISHAVMRKGGWGTRALPAGIKGWLEQRARSLRPTLKSMGLEPILLAARNSMQRATGGGGSTRQESRDLQGATVGLIGWGDNARAFAERLVAAQARVLVYSEHATDTEIAAAGATRASLGQVLSADVVSLHRGLSARTKHFLGAAELAQLRPGAVLINVARAALIEPKALLQRLKKGDVFACLDVFDIEPLPAGDPLRKLPNVFLTSHIAGGSRDMQAAAAEEVVQKVAAYLSGDASCAVAAERLQMMT